MALSSINTTLQHYGRNDPKPNNGGRQADTSTSSLAIWFIFSFATLLRTLIAFHPHSGQNNYHGSKKAYGGDFEAQRHWMELTYHLPIGDWYWYDLQYWGLDYPPLTAYISYICGFISHYIVGPKSVALYTSRGIEDPIHKAYMRATVLVLDLLTFGLAVYYVCVKTTQESQNDEIRPNIVPKAASLSSYNVLWTMLFALIQPAIILIDHGHFQYNTVAIGLSIASFFYMVQNGNFFPSCIIASVLFSLALNFKQMTLYYAPAIFCYLLGRCMSSSSPTTSSSNNQIRNQQGKFTSFLFRFIMLGLTVIITFAIQWFPFILYGPSPVVLSGNDATTTTTTTTPVQRFLHVLRRIFPLERGLFEGKVANLWCALSVKPFNIRDRIDSQMQPLMALLLTFLMMLPSCIAMLQLGMTRTSSSTSNKDKRNKDTSNNNFYCHWKQLLWATTSCALSFFLASFQVHEKSILLAVAPASLLLFEDPLFVEWFCAVAVWTLYPLLQVDRLQAAYYCIVGIFLSLIWIRRMGWTEGDVTKEERTLTTKKQTFYTVFQNVIMKRIFPKIIVPSTILILIGLHISQHIMIVPSHLPDLFDVLWSIVGCLLFCIAWFIISFIKLFPRQEGQEQLAALDTTTTAAAMDASSSSSSTTATTTTTKAKQQ